MTANVTLNGTTIRQRIVERIFTKKLTLIVPPTSTADTRANPKDVKVVDLRKVEERFHIMGFVDEADKDTIVTSFKSQGTIELVYDSDTYNVVIEKMNMKDEAKDQDTLEEREVEFTCVVGENV